MWYSINKRFYIKESRKAIVDAEISEIVKKNIVFESGNIKNIFKIKIIPDNGKEYECVYWGYTNLDVGDKVNLKLWKFSDDFLLVDSILITEKMKGEHDERGTV